MECLKIKGAIPYETTDVDSLKKVFVEYDREPGEDLESFTREALIDANQEATEMGWGWEVISHTFPTKDTIKVTLCHGKKKSP